MRRIRKFLRELGKSTSGNAIILMAMGMPVLIGSAGMAVDFAQWYMWKRELQFAVDQGALAGAWARAEAETEDTYEIRAKQEFNANLSQLSGKTAEPEIELADYNSGTDNSVTVSSSVEISLPFSQMVMGRATTVSASAQATYEAATNYTTCMLALDPDASGAFTLGGSASGEVNCGFGALSTADDAMIKNGNPTTDAGFIVSRGGIAPGFASNGTIHESVSNLTNPFEGLSPPSSPGGQVYECPKKTSTGETPTTGSDKTADVTTVTTISYTYWQGKETAKAKTQVTYSNARESTSSSTIAYDQTVSGNVVEGARKTVSETGEWTTNSWPAPSAKNEKIFEKKVTTVEELYTDVSGGSTTSPTADPESDGIARPQPGTYTNISIGCDTVFAPGVYVVNGTLDFGQNNLVTGTDVMFVMTGSGSDKIHINSKSEINLSGITSDTLINRYGMSAEQAAKLATMLFFDPVSTGDFKVNGNADIILDGILYMPLRDVKINGNASMGGACMMIAAGTLEFTGNNDMSSFCEPTGSSGFDLGGSTLSIRLVK